MLGESIIGFDSLVKEYIKILGINGEVEIKATKTEKGSLVIDILLEVMTNTPFDNISDCIALLKLVGREVPPPNLNNIKNTYDEINTLIGNNPLGIMIGEAIIFLILWTRRQKEKLTTEIENEKISKKIAEKLYKLIRGKKRPNKKFLKPFIENGISEIRVSSEKKLT